MLLDFVRMKDEATFDQVRWLDHRLSFTLRSSLTHDSGLTCMIPAGHGGKIIRRITLNGEEVTCGPPTGKGHGICFSHR